MLLTAMYSEEEAEVTAGNILGSALSFGRLPMADCRWMRQRQGIHSDRCLAIARLTHKNQEQRCSRATLSQKSNSGTSIVQVSNGSRQET